MLDVKYTSKFKKNYKLVKKRGYNTNLLEDVINMLRNEEQLPEKYCDHQLTGKYRMFRECHIMPDWLLVYYTDNENLVLILSATGTHSDLFNK